MPTARCAVPDCVSRCKHDQLMCRTDWFRVSRASRNRVWATWNARLEEETAATRAAHNDAKRIAISEAVAARRRLGV